MLVDSHAHIHFPELAADIDGVLEHARTAGVSKIITVGTNEIESAKAVAAAAAHANVWAVVGLHPHDADRPDTALAEIARLARLDKVVGIGECGLDYFRSTTSRDDQIKVFRAQIELGLELGLPMSFHIRDAFDDFWAVFDDYASERGTTPRGHHATTATPAGIRGVVHCFTGDERQLADSLDRGLYVALNGIMTFTKDEHQLAAARALPLDRMLLETDAPYLAPVPHRGHTNEPAFTADTARFLAQLRGESFEELAAATTANAERLFRI